MARVMRDATVTTVAGKLFSACGPSWLEDSYLHWSSVVKAWAVVATRALHYDDQYAIVKAIRLLDDAEMADRRDLEDEDD